jgi:hypothetical protein
MQRKSKPSALELLNIEKEKLQSQISSTKQKLNIPNLEVFICDDCDEFISFYDPSTEQYYNLEGEKIDPDEDMELGVYSDDSVADDLSNLKVDFEEEDLNDVGKTLCWSCYRKESNAKESELFWQNKEDEEE